MGMGINSSFFSSPVWLSRRLLAIRLGRRRKISRIVIVRSLLNDFVFGIGVGLIAGCNDSTWTQPRNP